MPRRQPLADVGRHQKRLLAITRDKALAHHEIVLNPPDDTPTYATATGESGSPDVGPYLIFDGEIPRATCTASA